MNRPEFPKLDAKHFAVTKEALHAYSHILGGWTSVCRSRRKHWWHVSLRVSLDGLTTGVLCSSTAQFEVALDLRRSVLRTSIAGGDRLDILLEGQSSAEIMKAVGQFLTSHGVSSEHAKEAQTILESKEVETSLAFQGYSSDQANTLGQALSAVAISLDEFRSSIRQETSPIQLWPHHFDLAMLWLPGDKIADQDADNEEYADKQMNYGFALGDDMVKEPYFYITAYPSSEAFSSLALPNGARWINDGFTGAVVTYDTVKATGQPSTYLLNLWRQCLKAGQVELMEGQL